MTLSHFVLPSMRFLGMYFEQAGIPAAVVPLQLLIIILFAYLDYFWLALLQLIVVLVGVPTLAVHATQQRALTRQVLRLSKNRAVTTLFFPGLGNDGLQLQRYNGNEHFPGSSGILLNPMIIHPYDANDFRRFNIAQKGDVNYALEQVRRIMDDRPCDTFILFGSSRGSAVALQVANLLDDKEVKRVAFLVCEGVFDDPRAVMHSRFGAFLTSCLELVLGAFTEYNSRNDALPLSSATNFAHRNLPVLLVTSDKDQVVERKHTDNIFKVLHARVDKCIYLVLKHSPHSSYATWDDRDREEYCKTIQHMIDTFIV
jgi:hypothetical protein